MKNSGLCQSQINTLTRTHTRTLNAQPARRNSREISQLAVHPATHYSYPIRIFLHMVMVAINRVMVGGHRHRGQNYGGGFLHSTAVPAVRWGSPETRIKWLRVCVENTLWRRSHLPADRARVEATRPARQRAGHGCVARSHGVRVVATRGARLATEQVPGGVRIESRYFIYK